MHIYIYIKARAGPHLWNLEGTCQFAYLEVQISTPFFILIIQTRSCELLEHILEHIHFLEYKLLPWRNILWNTKLPQVHISHVRCILIEMDRESTLLENLERTWQVALWDRTWVAINDFSQDHENPRTKKYAYKWSRETACSCRFCMSAFKKD